jgi:hypothetical protein
MYEQQMHMQHNSSTSGCYALVSSMDMCPQTRPNSITKAEGLAMEQNITAQRNTIGHKKGVQ